MRTPLASLGLLAATLLGTAPVAAEPAATLPSLRTPARPALHAQRIEVQIDGIPAVENPFDPDQVAVDLVAVAPSGATRTVPAFWGGDYERQLKDGREVLSAQGDPGWRARYLPLEPGKHQLHVTVRHGSSALSGKPLMLEVSPAPAPPRGLIRVEAGGRYFRFDDGTPLFLNGLCACWHGKRGTYDYDDWLAAYEKAGINYMRLWMWPNAFGIEWDKGDRLRYRLDTAWALDRVLAEAERRGVSVMLCLDYHGMFEVKPDFWNSNNFWPRHPYNAANGGPCANQDEFFTREEARALYRKRLRYIVARWTTYPNLLAWEFFNEIDNEYAYLKHEHVIAWHRDLSAHLRSIDPYQHLISSSFTGNSERPDLFALPNLDFSQYHSYNEKHPATMTAAKAAAFWERYRKPFFVSEYGTDWKGWKPDTDPHLRALHQAVWSGAFTGAAGTGMTWWWESIHEANLYRHWSALAAFLKGTAIASPGIRPVAAAATDGKVKAWAVATDREALLWLLDPAMSWPEGAMVDPPPAVAGAQVNVEGLGEGTYTVEWWDTLQGSRISTAETRSVDGKAIVSAPDFRVDLAAKIRRKD